MAKTTIEYADYTWNPIRRKGGGFACTKVSPGCLHCWAGRMNRRFWGKRGAQDYVYKTAFSERRLGFAFEFSERSLADLHRISQPSVIAVQFMSDLFHEDVPFDLIDRVFATMDEHRMHRFLVLTKRPERLHAYCDGGEEGVFPYENVWLGVSVEDMRTARERLPVLLATPAAKRFVSLEPLLGPIDLRLIGKWRDEPLSCLEEVVGNVNRPALDWVIVGGESGPGARPMHPDWVRSIRDQCVDLRVPFFFKQWGHHKPICEMYATDRDYWEEGARDRVFAMDMFGWIADGSTQPRPELQPWFFDPVGKKAAGRVLDGRVWDEIPERLTVVGTIHDDGSVASDEEVKG